IEADYEEAIRGRRLGALYAANTVGGASGALLAAYAVLPALGVNGTLLASAVVSGLVGVLALVFGQRETPLGAETEASATADADTARDVIPPESHPRSLIVPSSRDRALLFGFAFASGALVFASEVVFTHLLALIIGNSAYAFGLILTAFLISLFAGATLASPLRKRLGDNALPLGLAATGLALLGALPVWDELPAVFAVLGEAVTSFGGREAVRGATALAILIVPTTLMGLTFPLLLQRVGRYSGVGAWVGRLTAINTLGAVCGSLATGYIVLPALGSERTLIAIGACFTVSALLAGPWSRGNARKLTVAAAAASAAVVLVAPRWDLASLTSGSNVYFEGHEQQARLMSIREDVHGGVTTVTETQGVYTLYTNGKFQGNTGWEMNAQRLFAHYPSIFVESFGDALVIGLGTGTTLGTLTAYPWQNIDVVEISPAIVEAARGFFQVPNRNALDDPRVSLTLADGRNFLLVRPKRYDLIGMELSSIWFAGAASLYSDEFYRLVHERLQPRGVFQQWVQLHHIRRRDFATIVHTLRNNFEHVALFYGGGQGILVASEAPLRISRRRLAELEKRPAVRETEPQGRPLEALTNDILVLGKGLDAFLESIAEEAGEPVSSLLSTDENLYLEYATPRGNILPWSTRDDLVRDLVRFRDEQAIDALFAP
ncbi:MAG TPA: fused MFS/spermidine synthase, partial [Polyangiaceae bacterium]